MKLDATHFPTFFEKVHGYKPFPWQARLAAQVVETGRWPALLDLPTAAGKTAVIDIAVFHLAVEAQDKERRETRRAPMRMLFTIDRRIVVDAAFDRAWAIAGAFRNPKDAVVAAVADALSQLSGDKKHPLQVVRLRGGVPQERDWACSPAQPLVAISTVDQVGSRLLFRGYGVSPSDAAGTCRLGGGRCALVPRRGAPVQALRGHARGDPRWAPPKPITIPARSLKRLVWRHSASSHSPPRRATVPVTSSN